MYTLVSSSHPTSSIRQSNPIDNSIESCCSAQVAQRASGGDCDRAGTRRAAARLIHSIVSIGSIDPIDTNYK